MHDTSDLTLVPSTQAVRMVLEKKGIATPRITSHLFRPGDQSSGHENQCSVGVPTEEMGEVVGTNCGAPQEEHIQETYSPG